MNFGYLNKKWYSCLAYYKLEKISFVGACKMLKCIKITFAFISKKVFSARFEIAKTMEEQDFGEPSTPTKTSPNKSGEWKESDSGIEWVVSSAKKDKEENGDTSRVQPQESDKLDNLDDEETFTKGIGQGR